MQRHSCAAVACTSAIGRCTLSRLAAWLGPGPRRSPGHGPEVYSVIVRSIYEFSIYVYRVFLFFRKDGRYSSTKDFESELPNVHASLSPAPCRVSGPIRLSGRARLGRSLSRCRRNQTRACQRGQAWSECSCTWDASPEESTHAEEACCGVSSQAPINVAHAFSSLLRMGAPSSVCAPRHERVIAVRALELGSVCAVASAELAGAAGFARSPRALVRSGGPAPAASDEPARTGDVLASVSGPSPVAAQPRPGHPTAAAVATKPALVSATRAHPDSSRHHEGHS